MRSGRIALVITLALILTLFITIPAYAEENGPFHKLGRGLVNAVTGWMEIPKHIYEVSEETNPFTGLLFGSIRGAGMGISRAGYGTADTATFLIPEYDRPILDQKYVF